jgi:hypothetical protein
VKQEHKLEVFAKHEETLLGDWSNFINNLKGRLTKIIELTFGKQRLKKIIKR